MRHNDHDPLAYPVVPCRICGAPLMAHAWHCVRCAAHWPLTRDHCGTCQRARGFEFLATMATRLYLQDFELLPTVITIVPTLDDYVVFGRSKSDEEDLA
jgi:hypothetical protein